MPVFVLNHCGAGVPTSTRDHELPQLVYVVRSNRLRVSQLSRKDRRNTNFVGLDVDVRGDDRSRRIVDTLALKEHKPPVRLFEYRYTDHHVLPEQALLFL